jgi:predicted dehydrogenase
MNDKHRPLRIGVSGVGSIGFRHTRLLSQKGGIDIFAADPVAEHLQAVEGLSGVAAVASSFDELLEFGLDGIIVATPDRFHVPQAEAACRKGIAVLVEKPVAENAEQAEYLRQVCVNTNAKLLVGYPLRHNLIFRKAKEIVAADGIGEAISFHIMLGAYNTLIAAKNRFAPDDTNKLFVDYSHEWDYLNWFFGKVERVVAVSHTSGNREKKQSPNVVNALVETQSGISGTAHLDYIQSPGQRHFTIIGDEGVVAVDAVGGFVMHQKYDEDHQRIYKIQETFDGMMTHQLEHFIAVIRGTEEVLTTAEDGLNALKIADALIRSSKAGSWQRVS